MKWSSLVMVAAVFTGAGVFGWQMWRDASARRTALQEAAGLSASYAAVRPVADAAAPERPAAEAPAGKLAILLDASSDLPKSSGNLPADIRKLISESIDADRFQVEAASGVDVEKLAKDTTAVVEFGRKAGLRYVAIAHLSFVDEEYHLTLQLVDCENSRIEGRGVAVQRAAYQARLRSSVSAAGRIDRRADRPKRPNEILDAVAPPADFSLKLATGENKDVYIEGETISFVIEVDKDCYVTLVTRDVEGNYTLLLPNAWQQQTFVKAGKKLIIPSEGAGFRFPIQPPHGDTVVKAIATKEPLNLRGVTMEMVQKQKFVNLGGNPRAIGVEATEEAEAIDDRPLSERFKAGDWATTEMVIVTRPPRNQREREQEQIVRDEPSGDRQDNVLGNRDPNDVLLEMWRQLAGTEAPILSVFRGFDGGDSKSINGDEAAPPDELIIFRKGTGVGGYKNIGDGGESMLGKVEVIKLDDGSKSVMGPDEIARKIEEIKQKDPNAIAVIPNRKWKMQSRASTRFFPVQWGLENRLKKGNDIGWSKIAHLAQTADLPLIGVVDQGLHIDDPRLKHCIWTNPNEVPDNGKDDDNNGLVDDVHGFNFAKNNGEVYDKDEVFNHGTYCTSIIAARPVGGEKDVQGILPNATIIPSVVFGPRLKWEIEPQATTLSILYGIDYAARMGAKVINLSLGGQEDPAVFEEICKLPIWAALEEAGIILVIAAGNQGMDIDEIRYFPAHIPRSNIICVMATDPAGLPGRGFNYQTKQWAQFTNWGKNSAHLAAPGSLILGIPDEGQLAVLDGTSFAAPMVTAAVALLMSQHPDWSHHDIISAILETAKKSPELRGKCTTGGMLDLPAALEWKP